LANEIWHNYTTGNTLYFCAFQRDGNVFLTGGASDEVWGTGGRDADDYDETMTEDGTGGHYVGSFATSIELGTYRIAVYLQAGANPADTDREIAQGEIYWDGEAEETIQTIVITNQTITNVYDESTPPPVSVIDETLRV
jgi:hypothetical protein